MKFTKMHGIGNDYVYVNCFQEEVSDPVAVAKFVSDRHFGIGSDGLILIKPSAIADVEMDMYNADGSRGKMCGNGIRCVGKYAYDYGLTDKTQITVATGAGIKHLFLTVEEGKVTKVRVDMGAPIFTAKDIPVIADSEEVIDQTLTVAGQTWQATCVSMGNPHCIVPVEDVDHFPIEQIGPQFEQLPIFPERVNTEFIRVIDRQHVQMRVWERGSGETFACGTGACAVAAACIRLGLTDEHVTIHLLGGDLEIWWDQQGGTLWMTGSATTVFEGEIQL